MKFRISDFGFRICVLTCTLLALSSAAFAQDWASDERMVLSVQAEENIGLMLPCNVIVYERGGRTVLSVVRPTVAMQMIDNAELKSVAELVEKKLKNVFDAVP